MQAFRYAINEKMKGGYNGLYMICINNKKNISSWKYFTKKVRPERKSFSNSNTHTHTCWFLWFTGTFHRRNGFYTVQAVCAIALHLPYT